MTARDTTEDSDEAIVEYMRALHALEPPERHAALSAWARGPHFHVGFFVREGWQGSLAREAHDALRLDLEKDTPGRRWENAGHAQSRASIARMLGMKGTDLDDYATAPFRAQIDAEGKAWVAAAIGSPPFLDPEAGRYWTHLDITDVILWDPKANIAHVDGEHPSASALILPKSPGDRLTVFADPRAFFIAWAARRARTAELVQRRARGEWAHPIAEPVDGNLPGALIIGKFEQPALARILDVPVVHAGAGITKAQLVRAATAAANLPDFEEGDGASVRY